MLVKAQFVGFRGVLKAESGIQKANASSPVEVSNGMTLTPRVTVKHLESKCHTQ